MDTKERFKPLFNNYVNNSLKCGINYNIDILRHLKWEGSHLKLIQEGQTKRNLEISPRSPASQL